MVAVECTIDGVRMPEWEPWTIHKNSDVEEIAMPSASRVIRRYQQSSVTVSLSL